MKDSCKISEAQDNKKLHPVLESPVSLFIINLFTGRPCTCHVVGYTVDIMRNDARFVTKTCRQPLPTYLQVATVIDIFSSTSSSSLTALLPGLITNATNIPTIIIITTILQTYIVMAITLASPPRL
ncbi:unnamed protein product [Dibothriocephalus latus]|uniref:Uncharacterized protein n=1 Tax=Dibothriocephalus latus TaxID=60516 RepID=A0A3P7ND37_DIBLA|nr:unnamed protein product [Dibothriocephalus latus]